MSWRSWRPDGEQALAKHIFDNHFYNTIEPLQGFSPTIVHPVGNATVRPLTDDGFEHLPSDADLGVPPSQALHMPSSSNNNNNS
jgi:hypothetical protein